ncbi:MAG: hypothetical protein ACTHK7_16670 [Aureliella sp.]
MPRRTDHLVALYVDRSSRQWILRDPEGNFWIVPPVEDAWDHREPFEPDGDTELEPVPSHYTYMLHIPFYDSPDYRKIENSP